LKPFYFFNVSRSGHDLIQLIFHGLIPAKAL
jgi:hypothetical protein